MKSLNTCSRFFAILLTVGLLQGCSLFKRHSSVTRSEDPAPAAQAAPKTTTAFPVPNYDIALKSYKDAVKTYEEGNATKAKELFTGFLVDYPTHEKTVEARYYLGLISFSQSEYENAIGYLKDTVQSVPDAELRGETLLILGESYYATGLLSEAMAITYEIIPDEKTDQKLGLSQSPYWKKKRQFKSLYSHRVEAHLLRAKIFSKKGDLPSSEASLQKAKRLLQTVTGYGVSENTARHLKAEVSYQQMAILKHQCNKAKPEKISEEIFQKYAEDYYECIRPIQSLYCDVKDHGTKEDLEKVRILYKSMVFHLNELKDQLPPADTKIDSVSKVHFEQEMRDLMGKVISKNAEDFHAIAQCGEISTF